MKKLFLLSLIILLFAGCRKDKLVGAYSILEGKWQWVSTLESKELLSSGFTTYTTLNANDYPDKYFFEFSRSGHVNFLKNDELTNKYRTRVKVFSENCNIFPDCLMFIIRLDNKEDQGIMFNANSDSLECISSHTHLPLQSHSDNTYSYSYSYKFVKIN